MANENDLDLNKLVKEVSEELGTLIKREQDKIAAEALKKNETPAKQEEPKVAQAAAPVLEKKEESSKEGSMKKEESSKEQSMKKDDSMSMDAQPPQDQSQSAPPSPSASPEGDDHGSLEELLASLDDQKLQELQEKLNAEMAKRSQSQSAPAPDASASPAPSPSAAPAPEEKNMYMSEKKGLEDRLAKSEEMSTKVQKENEDLRKTVEKTLDLVTKLINRPARKAVTDINFVAKPGENELKKNEDKKPVSTEKEIHERLTVISRKPTLSKSERDLISDYYLSRKTKGKPEILKLIEKES